VRGGEFEVHILRLYAKLNDEITIVNDVELQLELLRQLFNQLSLYLRIFEFALQPVGFKVRLDLRGECFINLVILEEALDDAEISLVVDFFSGGIE